MSRYVVLKAVQNLPIHKSETDALGQVKQMQAMQPGEYLICEVVSSVKPGEVVITKEPQ